MKILFACGGTAGHINPALAIANKLAENKENEVLFVGTQKGMEARRIPEGGFDIKFIEISGLNRKNLFKNLSLPKKIVNSIKQSKQIVKEFQPDFVIGTGGYVTLPVIYSAHKLGIKTLIHEVNSVAGLATNLLSKYADIITCAFENTKIKTSKTIHCTGNPIRPELLRHCELSKQSSDFNSQPSKRTPQPVGATPHLVEADCLRGSASPLSVGRPHFEEPHSTVNYQLSTANCLLRQKLGFDSRPIILAFGGSLGAEVLNNAIEKLVLENNDKYQIIWATGERYFEDIRNRLVEDAALGVPTSKNSHSSCQLSTANCQLVPYIHNMSELLPIADIVITRAGGVLFEILALGKASIIIPSPNVTANHQVKNAENLAKKGAINMLLEEYIETLPQVIEQTIKTRKTLETNALKLAK
ncbi:MAG: UDP-N-acetylglucosamine--N-acetylmuramyl-(pentapeptide) pyrophosphoryl-undecaprenol N-acetylglucosamine transferase, partial [Oscillospiraceae bacterium]|nr:UDP-N-acetylglucosamine--N-acetylmuramyl-(pentapeptide) pyrophosphoryl-undecaprenol N-acetylglucosamine transferase [Oscillospiraceae bacterium]